MEYNYAKVKTTPIDCTASIEEYDKWLRKTHGYNDTDILAFCPYCDRILDRNSLSYHKGFHIDTCSR